MWRSDQLCHAVNGIRSAASRNTFDRRDTVSEDQGTKGRHANDPESGRDIPRGTDEESDAEGSNGGTGESAKKSASGGRHGHEGQQSRTDRDQGR